MSYVFLYKAARYEAKAHQNSKTLLFGHTPKIHHGKIRISPVSPPIQKGEKLGDFDRRRGVDAKSGLQKTQQPFARALQLRFQPQGAAKRWWP
jgi:hypothetical protein